MENPVILLSFATLLIVIGVAVWNLIAHNRRQSAGPKPQSGPGSDSDPLR